MRTRPGQSTSQCTSHGQSTSQFTVYITWSKYITVYIMNTGSISGETISSLGSSWFSLSRVTKEALTVEWWRLFSYMASNGLIYSNGGKRGHQLRAKRDGKEGHQTLLQQGLHGASSFCCSAKQKHEPTMLFLRHSARLTIVGGQTVDRKGVSL